MICLCLIHSTTFAFGVFWYDKNVEITSLTKAMLFPLSETNSPYDYFLNPKESSTAYQLNDYLFKQFSKKIKKLKFYRMTPGMFEKEQITVDKYDNLLIPFKSESERASAVYDVTAADLYLVPTFREFRVQTDISPRTEFDVPLQSWTAIYNSPKYPDKTIITDEKTWTEHFVVPETKIYLHITSLQFTGFDYKGNKVLTFVDERRQYGTYNDDQFKNMVKYFRKEFADVKSGKKFQSKADKSLPSIGFSNFNLPDNIANDEYFIKGFYFAMKDESFNRLKKFRIQYDSSTQPDYFIGGNLNSAKLVPYWNKPSVSVHSRIVYSDETKWKDKEGKEHTQDTTKYVQYVKGHPGYWSFSWHSSAYLRLVNSKTGAVIFSKTYSDSDDKLMDSWRHIFKDFYSDVNKLFKK